MNALWRDDLNSRFPHLLDAILGKMLAGGKTTRDSSTVPRSPEVVPYNSHLRIKIIFRQCPLFRAAAIGGRRGKVSATVMLRRVVIRRWAGAEHLDSVALTVTTEISATKLDKTDGFSNMSTPSKRLLGKLDVVCTCDGKSLCQ